MKRGAGEFHVRRTLIHGLLLLLLSLASCKEGVFYGALGDQIVSGPVTIAPAAGTIADGTSLTFSATGGTRPYTYSVVSGPGTINSSTGVFSASGGGTAVIRVTDKNKKTSDATINVTPTGLLAINPSDVSVGKNGTIQFVAVGGTFPYTFSIRRRLPIRSHDIHRRALHVRVHHRRRHGESDGLDPGHTPNNNGNRARHADGNQRRLYDPVGHASHGRQGREACCRGLRVHCKEQWRIRRIPTGELVGLPVRLFHVQHRGDADPDQQRRRIAGRIRYAVRHGDHPDHGDLACRACSRRRDKVSLRRGRGR